MAFWIIALLIAFLTAAPLVLVLLRARQTQGDTAANIAVEQQVYKDQLQEVDRDLSRDLLSDEAAKRARLEISRRMLDLDSKTKTATEGKALPVWLAGLAGIFVLVGGVALYLDLGAPNYKDLPLERRLQLAETMREARSSQETAEQTVQPSRAVETPDPEHLELLSKLRSALETRPDDLQGHMILARNAAAVGHYKVAYAAQARVIDLKAGTETAQDYADLADMMILAVGGYVSPEAETAVTKALNLDGSNGTALFYAGLMFAQTGRPDTAFNLWSKLLSASAPNDPWVPTIRGQIESLAQAAGVRYTLPPLAPVADTMLKGPTADDIEAAGDLDVEDRQAFIQSMVDQLSARLGNEGGTPEEWAQLISALGVLGETNRARAIWNEAQVLFGADPDATATVRRAAQSAGVTQ
jgi:cytochrome c-type biogenesis protein CcmH